MWSHGKLRGWSHIIQKTKAHTCKSFRWNTSSISTKEFTSTTLRWRTTWTMKALKDPLHSLFNNHLWSWTCPWRLFRKHTWKMFYKRRWNHLYLVFGRSHRSLSLWFVKTIEFFTLKTTILCHKHYVTHFLLFPKLWFISNALCGIVKPFVGPISRNT
jgi:hypothetical protein